MNLAFIPKKISDLRNFVVLPEISERVNGGRLFTRITTAPPGPSGLFRSSITDRTRSIADASVGLDKDAIHLYLSGNRIRSLPSELFSLKRMTVLILRSSFSYTRLHLYTNHVSNVRCQLIDLHPT